MYYLTFISSNEFMKTESAKVVTVSLPASLVDDVDSAVESFRRSRSNLVRIALENMLRNPATAPLARQTLAAPDDGSKREPTA